MSHSIPFSPIERLRRLVTLHLGLQFDETRTDWLAELLQRHARRAQLSDAAFVERLERGMTDRQLDELAQEVTVPETFFFRNIDQFRALQEEVLPQRLPLHAASRCLSILSAGCASGEEPYSIAMALQGRLPEADWATTITAVDVNPAMIDKARRARYTAWSLRETPPEARARWFRAEGNEWTLDDGIRRAVTFEQRNLHAEDPEFWRPGRFDVVFCRNVLMYFEPAAAQAIVSRIARSLAPGGVLFLGHAETMRGLSDAFDLRHTHGTFYYQLRSTAARGAPPSGAWADEIARATDRVRVLTRPPDVPSPSPSTDAPVPAGDVAQALALLHQERFAEALEVIQGLPATQRNEPDVMLLNAVLLLNRGPWPPAEEACHRLLAVDRFSAGAHYVLGLCREAVGDRAGSIERHQRAARLDPSFAMPRLHLGLLARRAGDSNTMRLELKKALDLLQRESASRVQLFGGGFDRGALIALCRAELRAAEALP